MEIPKKVKEDEILGVILKKIPDFKFEPNTNTLYNALIRAIAGQQLSTKAAATIYNRFLALFDGIDPNPSQVLETEHAVLRSVGFSNRKCEYIKNVANFFNNIDEASLWELSDTELIDKLVSIKGVGKWTVEMLLIFTLGRQDIFSSGDLGIQIAMAANFDLDRKDKKLTQKMEVIAERWKPYRTWASLLMWQYKDKLIKLE